MGDLSRAGLGPEFPPDQFTNPFAKLVVLTGCCALPERWPRQGTPQFCSECALDFLPRGLASGGGRCTSARAPPLNQRLHRAHSPGIVLVSERRERMLSARSCPR